MARVRDWSKGLTEKENEYMKSLDDKKIAAIKRRHCINCAYFSGPKVGSNICDRHCDYILITGKTRPCLPGKCKQKGVWVDKEGGKIKRKKKGCFGYNEFDLDQE
jgi:hypothetical protein